MSAAMVRMVCGACGAAVGPTDTACPSCGAALEHVTDASGRLCPVCGYRNDPAGETCVSCGARLAPGSGPKKAPRQVSLHGKARSSGGRARRSPEPWIYVAGLSVLVLIAYVVYLALRTPPISSASGSRAPVGTVPLEAAAASGGVEQLASLEQAVRDSPGDAEALLKLANSLHDHREWERAVQTYQRYLQKNPENPDARVDMGICYYELSQANPERGKEYFAEAVDAMENALKRSPKYVPAAFNLGIIYLQRGELQTSNEWFRRVVAMDKNHPLAQRAERMLEQHSFTN
jgi:cytochrome c-type biogenesis protein CcmH/NrfG/predicted RNA-binding Zn-ribbon protein involved in translation (DUF1610 family)